MANSVDPGSLSLAPKRSADSDTEMVEVVLPNDTNPLGFILGGRVMHRFECDPPEDTHMHAACDLGAG